MDEHGTLPVPIKWLSKEEAMDKWPTSIVDRGTVYNFPRLFYWTDDYGHFDSYRHSYPSIKRKKKTNPRRAKQKAAKMARKVNRNR